MTALDRLVEAARGVLSSCIRAETEGDKAAILELSNALAALSAEREAGARHCGGCMGRCHDACYVITEWCDRDCPSCPGIGGER